MSIVQPIIPEDKLTIIATRQGRAIVSRYIQTDSYAFEVESAANWEALELAAIQVVEEQIGAIVEDAHYECPAGLAEKAEWKTKDLI